MAVVSVMLCLGQVNNAGAVEKRYGMGTDFQDHIVLTVFAGGGFPSGDFGSSSVGNHETGFSGALEFEWYFSRQTSLGLTTRESEFEDKDFGDDLVTNVTSYGVFIKHTIPAGDAWFGYGKFALNWTELNFEDPGFITKTDGGWGVLFGAGILYRTSDLLSVNGQLAYNKSFTENADLPGFAPGTEVGFDVQYISIDVGVSFYFGT
jgi:hypothetical protein